MAIARVFKSGTGQAVQLPKEFRFRNRKIMVFRRGNEIVLRERSHAMARAFELLTG
jgi:antitoxin VapB